MKVEIFKDRFRLIAENTNDKVFLKWLIAHKVVNAVEISLEE